MDASSVPQNRLVVIVGSSAPPSGHAEAALRRHLAQTRLTEAMRLTEQAQILLDRAARNLSPIIGAAPKHQKTGALIDRVRGALVRVGAARARRQVRVGRRGGDAHGPGRGRAVTAGERDGRR
jgi:hypothetical protein